MPEYSIPIMFDVTSATEAGAVARLVDALVDAELTAVDGIDSWWTIKAGHKQFDGNDNNAGRVVFGPEPEATVEGREVWAVTFVEAGLARVTTDFQVYSDRQTARTEAENFAGPVNCTASVTRQVIL